MILDARLRSVLDHLDEAARLWTEAAVIADELGGPTANERVEKMFSKYMQDGYTEMEAAMRRILALAGEQEPVGPDFHRDLVEILGLDSDNRPAFLPHRMEDIDELRRFRDVSLHGYRRFDWNRATPAIAAARTLSASLSDEARAFLDRWTGFSAPSAKLGL